MCLRPREGKGDPTLSCKLGRVPLSSRFGERKGGGLLQRRVGAGGGRRARKLGLRARSDTVTSPFQKSLRAQRGEGQECHLQGVGQASASTQNSAWWGQAACLPRTAPRPAFPAPFFLPHPALSTRVPGAISGMQSREKGRQAGFKLTSDLLCEPREALGPLGGSGASDTENNFPATRSRWRAQQVMNENRPGNKRGGRRPQGGLQASIHPSSIWMPCLCGLSRGRVRAIGIQMRSLM